MPAALIDQLPARRLPLWFVAAAAGYFVLLKLVLAFGGQVQIDEAYYWMWGQHPQLSYVDHPALNAWLQGLMSTSTRHKRAGTACRRPVDQRRDAVGALRLVQAAGRRKLLYAFLVGIALYFSSPLSVFVTTMALHDHLMLVFGILAIHCFALVGGGYAENGRVRLVPLYLGAAFLGLAVLTKLIGVSAGLGIACWSCASPGYEGPLSQPPPVAGGDCRSADASADADLEPGAWPTVTFHLGGMQCISASGPDILGAWHIVYEAILLLSPFIIWGMFRYLTSRSGQGFGGVLHHLGGTVFIASSLVLVLVEVALGKSALYYWNMLAYCVYFGVAVGSVRSRCCWCCTSPTPPS